MQKETSQQPEDLNLRRLLIRLINTAYERYPEDTDVEIADRIGITERSLYNYILAYRIDKKSCRMKGRAKRRSIQAIEKQTA